jgi:glucose/arabinose dehydrogenase
MKIRTLLCLLAPWLLAAPTHAGVPDPDDTALAVSPELSRPFRPAQPPPGMRLRLEPVATGLEQPIYVTAPPRGSRLFVIERVGRIRVIDDGTLQPSSFLDLTEAVDWGGERGLLGLAFAPDFETSHRFYVAYSDKVTLATVVARYQATPDGQRARPETREEILRIAQAPDRIDHKAGWIGFRPGDSACLYIASGDGGGHNDPDNAAQNLRDRRGKILRVDVSGSGPGFAVPRDNPFAKRRDALPEIWAFGVRNPFRTSFDRETGDLYFGDVGQDAREEVNFEPAGSPGGRNYGWRLLEGPQRNRVDPKADTTGLTAPILSYAHEEMMFLRGCVIGGYVYRGTALPELRGAYFFADFTNARIYSVRTAGGEVSELTDWTGQLNPRDEKLAYSGLASFGEDAAGELYVVDFAGTVLKVVR